MGPRAASLACCLAVAWLLAVPALAGGPQRPGRLHQTYFANTPNELNVYRVFGAQDGPTLMLIGGIQGDEPGGFLSADLYADIALARGNLIVVPRANVYSIILNNRGPDGDMNRQFGNSTTAQRHKKIVEVLKGLMAESHMLLNLHDGSGFYRPRWEGPQANPRRFGQSLIADTDRYPLPDGRVLELGSMAEKVLARVNAQIEDRRYQMAFNNHRTAQPDTVHKEQRLSATFYALTRCHIPAFGVETSKSLPSEAMKIKHHNLVINAFMDELGIVPESPASSLPPPEFKYLVVSVNDRQPVVVAARGSLQVAPGDRVVVQHIEANYERGLTCDIQGMGSVNDLRQEFAIKKSTRIAVRKDSQQIGQVEVQVVEGLQPLPALRSPILYFLVEVQGQRRLVADGETLRLVKGDRLVLVDVLSNLPNQANILVNFKGFVPSGSRNQGEDRRHPINTAQDLLDRFSDCGTQADPDLRCYHVKASQGGQGIGGMTVEVSPARLDYLVLRKGGHKLVYHNGETIRAASGESLEVMDVKSNVSSDQELGLALDGRGRRVRLAGSRIDMAADSFRELAREGQGRLKLVVLRDEQDIGHLGLDIGGR